MILRWFHIGVVHAHHFYNDFSDKSNQGPAFTWKNFPNLAVRLTKVQAPFSYKTKLYKLSEPLYLATAWIIAYTLSTVNREDERIKYGKGI